MSENETDYQVVACYDCGLAYGSEGWIECMLPAETWSEISPTHDAGGILCITCIARRLKRATRARVPVMLCGTEAIIAAGQDEAFDRGWRCAEKRILELDADAQRYRAIRGSHTLHTMLGFDTCAAVDVWADRERAALAATPEPR